MNDVERTRQLRKGHHFTEGDDAPCNTNPSDATALNYAPASKILMFFFQR